MNKKLIIGDIIVVDLGTPKDRIYAGISKLCMFYKLNGHIARVIPITSCMNNSGERKKINKIDIFLPKGEGNLDKYSILLISQERPVDIVNIKYSIGRVSDKTLNQVIQQFSKQHNSFEF